MNRNGPVVVIEDDPDDQEILARVFKRLNYSNEVVFFYDAHEALDFLNKEDVTPFLVLSDINMPKLDGFALRDRVNTDQELQVKCIPYLFFSTASDQRLVVEAYKMSVQGYFVKPETISELEHTIRLIMDYWKKCIAPNDFVT